MIRPSGRLLAALCASLALHAGGGSALWRFLSERALDGAPPLDEAQAIVIEPPGSAPLAVAVLEPTVAEGDEAPPDFVPPEARAGDEDRAVVNASAPTSAPNPDRFALAAAASSGDGAGRPRLDLTGRRDDEELRAQLMDADSGYQLQRIRTARDRVSREDVRATPHPADAPELASLDGEGRARRTPGARALGRVDGAIASAARSGLPAGDGDGDRARAAARANAGAAKIGKDGEDASGFARPLIAAGPAATDAGRRSIDVADRADAAQVSSERAPGRIELSHPAPLGAGVEGRGVGALPAWARRGHGDEAVPAGDPDAPRGEDLALQTYRRSYDRYVSDVTKKVDPLWQIPHAMALRLEQGDLLVGFTIRRDGTVHDIRVLKRSGYPELDDNVVAAIHRAAPFRPLPAVFGSELRVTAPFVAANPAVR